MAARGFISSDHAPDYLQSPTVKIKVGNEQDGKEPKESFVHKGLLCGRSEFFTTALNGSWAEADSNEVNLPEDDPDIFVLYQALLYTNLLHIKHSVNKCAIHGYLQLSKLYILCSKLLVETSIVMILDTIIALSEEKNVLLDLKSIRNIFDGTVEEMPLARHLSNSIQSMAARTSSLKRTLTTSQSSSALLWPLAFWLTDLVLGMLPGERPSVVRPANVRNA
ncbi:hypothetical protein M011DRAFT_454687 [Sporormia fimetaria CBS 119925]|uniref:BTB domain-containing protein n=1 Tax=Sporormia fimetaria CBS 119925 TaxID=1340428 RepID=A0A6A6VPJ7_9PLEO|nr:hypothetical protein M011DRAFT_454687 [Sporormia fimetaria CBS 119925]